MSLGTSVVLAALLGTQYAGCPIFTPGDYYNRPVMNAPVDRNSALYIRSMVDAGNKDGFWAASEPVEYINIARAGTPMVNVHPKVSYHDFDKQYPWDAHFQIEPERDAHAMVLKTDTCHLYETYDTSFFDGILSAYSGADWDLRKPFVPLPEGVPSSMASGLSMFAGMVKWEEVQRGRIDHALNWAPPAHTVAQWNFVRPASDTDGWPYNGNSQYQLPYGAHLRLRRSFDLSHLGRQAKIIAQAMKEYGIFLADTGSQGNAIYNAVPLAGGDPWDKNDLSGLASIHISDFEVLKVPPIRRVRR